MNAFSVLSRIIYGAWIGFLAVWLVSSLATKRTVQASRGGSRILQIVLVLSAAYLLLRYEPIAGPLGWRILPETVPMVAAGAVLVVTGIVFAIVARFFIGRNWSSSVTVKQDHELICAGPYRLVRHPIYSGLLLAMLGTAMAIGEVRGLVAVLLAFIGWKLKSQSEEALMEKQFGYQYDRYRRNVKALIPFVW